MPELVEQMYCSQQIVIPPKFPYILKRYCKAAIKTQPYDLLRWSYEYFKALSLHRPPPVKIRLEYPVYSTQGGLTRGCLKVLAQQLSGMDMVPLAAARAAWQGFCLEQQELRRIFCLCGVHLREESVPFLHFIAVAAGFLTKNLTHTMILLCESLTKEPDGGSAAIPVMDFLTMYRFLAKIDASRDIKYYNGYPEGTCPTPEPVLEEEHASTAEPFDDNGSDDFWAESDGVQKLSIIDAHVGRGARLSSRINAPALGRIERSPSVERASQIERENYLRERKGRVSRNEEIDKKLREMSSMMFPNQQAEKEEAAKGETKFVEKRSDAVEIFVYDEDNNAVPFEFYGEAKDDPLGDEENLPEKPEGEEEPLPVPSEADQIAFKIAELYQKQEERLVDLEQTFEEIASIVDRYKSANYDLGMVAGRQMSTTSGEFIVQHIEQEIMASVDEQIAVLPDPDLKKKKAKPEEVAMIKNILETFLDENMDIIAAEHEEVEEEEIPVPEVTMVYAVPGIGPIVEDEIIREFEDYVLDACKVQADVFMPRNIRHFLCPPLERFTESYEELEKQNEELATSGAITE